MSPHRPTLSLNRDPQRQLYLLVSDSKGHTYQIHLGQANDSTTLLDLAQQCDDLALMARLQCPQINQDPHTPSIHLPEPMGSEMEDVRYTSEGIDRQFQATPGFVADVAAWERDSVNDWTNLKDEDLVRYYQLHFESYVQGCAMEQTDPTYRGFRQYLKALKDDPT